ncbi:MAG: flagellar hook-basal body complex protein FliE [Cellulomonas sp.]|nr:MULTISPECIES: flagellar hook-basal body complex protein FliE [Cellulomonas]KMM46912.1 flagellar hook-basal body protein FliE [Cellulomonas sp. A375-1]MCR6649602.1 flagellar hook-basal body complex protein FliE [Cellulomonas sp.]MCR6705573.1 flagellar hook-basal body complex protein FliE [Cellulomonas sp.]
MPTPVAPIGAFMPTAVTAVAPSTAAGGLDAAAAASGAQFGSVLSSVDSLQAMQSKTAGLAVAAVTGDLENVHDYTIAAAESSLALELTAAVRNKAVDAFNEIMRMQA